MSNVCGLCGQWYEYTHSCPSVQPTIIPITPTYTPPQQVTVVDYGALYLRFALALERIAAALETAFKRD